MAGHHWTGGWLALAVQAVYICCFLLTSLFASFLLTFPFPAHALMLRMIRCFGNSLGGGWRAHYCCRMGSGWLFAEAMLLYMCGMCAMQGLFNFKPSVRPVPLECHIQVGAVQAVTRAAS